MALKIIQLAVRAMTASVIAKGFSVGPVLGIAGHLPRFAQQTAGSLVLRSFTLVVSHIRREPHLS